MTMLQVLPGTTTNGYAYAASFVQAVKSAISGAWWMAITMLTYAEALMSCLRGVWGFLKFACITIAVVCLVVAFSEPAWVLVTTMASYAATPVRDSASEAWTSAAQLVG